MVEVEIEAEEDRQLSQGGPTELQIEIKRARHPNHLLLFLG
jgi:hypothetical protein